MQNSNNVNKPFKPLQLSTTPDISNNFRFSSFCLFRQLYFYKLLLNNEKTTKASPTAMFSTSSTKLVTPAVNPSQEDQKPRKSKFTSSPRKHDIFLIRQRSNMVFIQGLAQHRKAINSKTLLPKLILEPFDVVLKDAESI